MREQQQQQQPQQQQQQQQRQDRRRWPRRRQAGWRWTDQWEAWVVLRRPRVQQQLVVVWWWWWYCCCGCLCRGEGGWHGRAWRDGGREEEEGQDEE